MFGKAHRPAQHVVVARQQTNEIHGDVRGSEAFAVALVAVWWPAEHFSNFVYENESYMNALCFWII